MSLRKNAVLNLFTQKFVLSIGVRTIEQMYDSLNILNEMVGCVVLVANFSMVQCNMLSHFLNGKQHWF